MSARASSPLWQRQALEEALARTVPDVLALLGDGNPRSRRAIVATLAGCHPREDVTHAVMRLAVTGEIVRSERGYRLASAEDAGN